MKKVSVAFVSKNTKEDSSTNKPTFSSKNLPKTGRFIYLMNIYSYRRYEY
jgi:hypothetical protein